MLGTKSAMGRVALLAGVIVGCRHQPSTGSIEGDVFLVMQSGDVKQGAGNTVYLIRASDSLSRRLAAICADFRKKVGTTAATMPSDDAASAPTRLIGDTSIEVVQSYVTVLKESTEQLAEMVWGAHSPKTTATRSGFDSLGAYVSEAKAAVRAQLALATVSQTGTGMKAHYRFDHALPGTYDLWAETTIGNNPYTWWAPLTVKAGDSLHVDLDNSKEKAAALYCGSSSGSLTSETSAHPGRRS